MAKRATSMALAALLVAAVACLLCANAGARVVLEDTPAAADANKASAVAAASSAARVDDQSAIDTPYPRSARAAARAAAPAGTVARASKLSDREAKAALAKAEGIKKIVESGGNGSFPPPNVQPAVCGPNSLVKSGLTIDCRLVLTWKNSRGAVAKTSSCSAFVIHRRYLGTARHCVFSKDSPKGWATHVDVYCNGSDTCNTSTGKRTTWVTDMITTGAWTGSFDWTYDMAVVRTAGNLPGPSYAVGQAARNQVRDVAVTGYPAKAPEYRCGAQYTTCNQYTSTGTLNTGGSGSFISDNVDFCPGNSGGSVYDWRAGFVSAVVSNHVTGPCYNRFTAQVNKANVNAESCTGATGVSLYCLMDKLPPP